MDIELKGTVTLDKETMDELETKIREEVINDIAINGNCSSEIEKYLNNCSYDTYMRLLECTIDGVINRTTEDDIHFESGWRRWHLLLAIKSLLKI